jgi:hypothetical protein
MSVGIKRVMQFAVVLLLSAEVLGLMVPILAVKGQQQVAVGVYPGDSFTYGTPDGSPWVSVQPSSAPLSKWEQFMNLSTITIHVLSDVNNQYPTDPGYTVNTTVTFRNGSSPESAVGGFDLYTGGGQGSTFFVSAGLENGSYIYPGAVATNYTWTINETRIDTLNWPGEKICVLNYTTRTSIGNGSSPLIAEESITYWDQRTGVLLGAFDEVAGYDPTTGGQLTGVLLYELIANNVGIPMNYPSSFNMTPIYIAGAIGGVAVVGVIVVRANVSGKSKGKYKRLKTQ